MTLPLFLALHVVYGTLVGQVLFPRMRAEGEVLGPPLLLTLVPVALVSAPVGTILMRYAGGWFLHGLFVGGGSVAYERFHFGLLLAVILGAGVATVAGVLNVAIWASRDRPVAARAGLYVGGGVALLTLVLDLAGVFIVRGTGGRYLWLHPAGLLSVAVVVVLFGWISICRSRFAAVPEPRQIPGQGVPRSVAGPLV
jgi:hypothetical protein